MSNAMSESVRIESKGSIWFFNESNMQYLRMPKSEGPRPDYGDGPEAKELLRDLVWLPYEYYDLDNEMSGYLVIMPVASKRKIYAPLY